MAVDDRDLFMRVVATTCRQCAVREQDGPAKPPGAGKNATDVIGVFMRYQHRIDIVTGQVQPRKPPRHFSRSKTGIDQHPGIARFYQQGVAPAAATERGEAHLSLPDAAYFNWSYSRVRMRREVSDLSMPPSRVRTSTVVDSPVVLR